MGRAALVAFAAALALVAAACGGSGQAGGETISSTATTASTGGIDAMPGASTNPVTSTATAAETALMKGLAVGRHQGYDRVTFTFKNTAPGYRVAYVQPPFHSGRLRQDRPRRRVRVRPGAHGARLGLRPRYRRGGAPVYKGPKRISGADAGTSVVQDVVRTGDFEAVLTWMIGLLDPVDFRVLTLASPPRLAVDFRNH